MASSVNYSQYYYKWGTIRFRWIEFGGTNGKRRMVDDYLCTFFSKAGWSPFLRAVCFDESTQLIVRYKDYQRMKAELESIIDMELPLVGNTRLSSTNPVTKSVEIKSINRLKNVLRSINDQNNSLRRRQQVDAREYEKKVKDYLRANPAATFLIIDLEMYEHNRSLITEVGYVVFQRNHYGDAKYHHYIIAENKQYVNKDHVPDNRDGFVFGSSVVTSWEEVKAALIQQLKGVDAIVGHNLKEDEKGLEGISFTGKFLIDTQELAFAQASDPRPMALKHVLEVHNVPCNLQHFHNAGNDCHYTMKAFEQLTKYF